MSYAESSKSQSIEDGFRNVRNAAQAVGSTLGNTHYAVVGGAACVMLGSIRETEDVDFVVPKNGTKTARSSLEAQDRHFTVDKRTLHTWYNSTPPIAIEILSPPKLFAESFDNSTPVIVVDGVKVLKPALILNAKCYSVLGRATEGKKETDARDIRFLLGWCAKNCSYPTMAEVPNASKQFVEWFITKYGDASLWTNAGYNLETGRFA